MADKERAKKLAAAKKKLKAYKSGDRQTNEVKSGNENVEKNSETPKLQNYFNNKDNCNDFLLPVDESNFSSNSKPNTENRQNPTVEESAVMENSTCLIKTFQENNSNQLNNFPISNNVEKEKDEKINETNTISNSADLLKTIQILISEKAHLSKESSKLQISCKEKTFEIEEMASRLNVANKRIEDLEQFYFTEQNKNKGTEEKIQNLETELKKYKNQSDEFAEHIEELKRELSVNKSRILDLEKEVEEKRTQLEANNSRINQISDENNSKIDNRIEVLTQTKFMYEQQIVDLQSMVQQLRSEKEQANQQYQNYVQHLNKDIASLSEKNSELTEENTKLAERERDLVNHIGTLEKDIQQNITKNENLRQNMKNVFTGSEETSIQEDKFKCEIDELKKSEVELKKTIEEKLNEIIQYRKTIENKSEEITALNEKISNLEADRPNDAKLLASMESDKVAASRAMSQNSELRKQLDELQLKLIELTNDKMDLTNTLDSERFINKQTRQNFEDLQNQIKNLSDQLHFKDEEMIRLSHENNELDDKLKALQKVNDRLTAIPNEDSSAEKIENVNQFLNTGENVECETKPNDGIVHSCSHNNSDNMEHSEKDNQLIHISDSTSENSMKRKDSDTLSLPTSEAMWRLEERFKKLMGEVADLSDEKQQLEHIVLQLQGETETIGEYIALYQSQRKILKQKEYERDAQLKRLLAEREDLRNKALQLDTLIKQIGLKSNDSNSVNLTEMLNKQNLEIKNIDNEKNLTNGHYENNSNNAQETLNYIMNVKKDDGRTEIENNNTNKLSVDNMTESDSQKIIDRIQSLVADLKNNKEALPLVSTSADHCACCSGNLETI